MFRRACFALALGILTPHVALADCWGGQSAHAFQFLRNRPRRAPLRSHARISNYLARGCLICSAEIFSCDSAAPACASQILKVSPRRLRLQSSASRNAAPFDHHEVLGTLHRPASRRSIFGVRDDFHRNDRSRRQVLPSLPDAGPSSPGRAALPYVCCHDGHSKHQRIVMRAKMYAHRPRHRSSPRDAPRNSPALATPLRSPSRDPSVSDSLPKRRREDAQIRASLVKLSQTVCPHRMYTGKTNEHSLTCQMENTFHDTVDRHGVVLGLCKSSHGCRSNPRPM